MKSTELKVPPKLNAKLRISVGPRDAPPVLTLEVNTAGFDVLKDVVTEMSAALSLVEKESRQLPIKVSSVQYKSAAGDFRLELVLKKKID